MPQIETSDSLIKPISKRFLVGGNLIIVFFIFMIVISLFFVSTQSNYSTEVIIVLNKDSLYTAYCIIPKSDFEKIDLNSLRIEEEMDTTTKITGIILKEILLDSQKEEYILSYAMDEDYETKGPISLWVGSFKINNTTWGKIIFNFK